MSQKVGDEVTVLSIFSVSISVNKHIMANATIRNMMNLARALSRAPKRPESRKCDFLMPVTGVQLQIHKEFSLTSRYVFLKLCAMIQNASYL